MFKWTCVFAVFTSSRSKRILQFGFPSFFSVNIPDYKRIIANVSPEHFQYEADFKSTPTVSFGYTNNLISDPTYFSADIINFYGFSGGAVVYNNKLIGIVHGYDTIYKKTNSLVLSDYIIFQSIFVKSELLLSLIRKVENR